MFDVYVSATGHTTARWIGSTSNVFLILKPGFFGHFYTPRHSARGVLQPATSIQRIRKAQLPLVVVSWQRNKFWRRVHHTLQGMQAGVKPAAPLGDGFLGSREPALIKIRGQHTKPCCTMLVRVR